MKIQVISDLHREMAPVSAKTVFTPSGEVVVLAGDITNARNLGEVGREFGGTQTPVLYVLGNHDYYGHTWEDGLAHYRKFYSGAEPYSNIRVLENDVYTIGNVHFLGTTLWPDVRYQDEHAVARCISDFRAIRGATVEKMRAAHQTAVAFLDNTLARLGRDYPDDKKIVITHYPPMMEVRHPRWGNPVDDALSSYFYNDLIGLVLQHQPDYWIYGHTHDNVAVRLGRTHVLSNQHGYLSERRDGLSTGYDPKFCIEV